MEHWQRTLRWWAIIILTPKGCEGASRTHQEWAKRSLQREREHSVPEKVTRALRRDSRAVSREHSTQCKSG